MIETFIAALVADGSEAVHVADAAAARAHVASCWAATRRSATGAAIRS